jgi:GNAT superfamily N-acetyltransferase
MAPSGHRQMAGWGDAVGTPPRHHRFMHARTVRIPKLGLVTIRPLANGDTETVAALFDRLGDASRARRFNGAKPRLSARELDQLARVDERGHQLVAYVEGDPAPAGIAQLVRDARCATHAEIAFAVADCYQGRGIGSTLVDLLAADARAAGITHVVATMQSSNPVARSLVQRVSRIVESRQHAGETTIVAAFTTT